MKALLLASLLIISFFAIACQKKQPVTPPPPQQPAGTEPAQPSPQPPAPPIPDHTMHQGHKEVKVPTPLAELHETPLDLAEACNPSICNVLILYRDRVEILDWQKGETRSIVFPGGLQPALRSRSPAGKILKYANGYLVLNNNLANPVFLNADLQQTPGVYTSKPDWLPLPAPGRNWFSINDGHFYDFEFIPSGIAAVDTEYRLNIVDSGNLQIAAEKAGPTLALTADSIYTSSPSLPSRTDAILKFEKTSLREVTSRLTEGQILDLCVTDLNRDGENELLVTINAGRGIFIQVLELF